MSKEPKATRRTRLGKSSEVSGTRGVRRLFNAVERRQRKWSDYAEGIEVPLECRRACSRLPPQAGAGKGDSLMMARTRGSGFGGFLHGLSLVELLLCLAIAAILLSLALPSYQRYVQRGHRVDAIRLMLELASCQERIRAETGFYDTSRCQHGFGSEFYLLRFEPPDEVATLEFTIIADPMGPGIEDICGSLSLDQAGIRGIGGEPDVLGACWGGR